MVLMMKPNQNVATYIPPFFTSLFSLTFTFPTSILCVSCIIACMRAIKQLSPDLEFTIYLADVLINKLKERIMNKLDCNIAIAIETCKEFHITIGIIKSIWGNDFALKRKNEKNGSTEVSPCIRFQSYMIR